MNHESMAVLQCPTERRMSAILFGNRYRLELLVALAEAGDEGVNLSQLGAACGASPNVYYGPIKDLITVGLVERLGQVGGDRRCWYRRRPSSIWAHLGALSSELALAEAGTR
jgi:hypothetical protein